MLRGLILGGAACVWDDAEAALKLGDYDAVCAVKDMIADWPGRVDYGVSLHPERNAGYLKERKRKGYPGRPQIWSHRNSGAGGRALTDRETTDWAGSSGLLAVKVLLAEGFERIVLAGVPMTKEAGHYRRGEPWAQAKRYLGPWKARVDELRPFVRSMSGYTKALLGAPSPDWFDA